EVGSTTDTETRQLRIRREERTKGMRLIEQSQFFHPSMRFLGSCVKGGTTELDPANVLFDYCRERAIEVNTSHSEFSTYSFAETWDLYICASDQRVFSRIQSVIGANENMRRELGILMYRIKSAVEHIPLDHLQALLPV